MQIDRIDEALKTLMIPIDFLYSKFIWVRGFNKHLIG